eukprot:TRINITY_DN1323_c0_g1_i1.p1 TRINITY_DN1323_c0_g1~~TRINITY_DN1323_c0_g1_i1.p1  ORF type:complete len:695 (+),score=199.55 TRINITY_DN1323_c0_g1_i1:97-2181(+)
MCIRDSFQRILSLPTSLSPSSPWLSFAPKIVSHGNGYRLHTRLSTLLGGLPPVLVAGMTPCTVSAQFVAAINSAGFYAELAAGGLPTLPMFESRISELALLNTESRVPIALNLLFLNPTQWAFQWPAVQQLISRGLPIGSITVGAGVPSEDKADELLALAKSIGLTFVGFKPGSSDAIRDVIGIAQRNPQSKVVLQWTGGRAGGHHSFEDMHAPIAELYSEVRACDNIVLVAGSGIGDAASALPYLSGAWSVQRALPAMPFDGVLMGSRVMVSAECELATPAKELVVACPGVEHELDWEQSYDGLAGGIVTVNSELGEPIHVVHNRCTELWRKMDNEFFSLAQDKLQAKLSDVRVQDEIIRDLNRDHMKLWFGCDEQGQPLRAGVAAMSYRQVALRMVELMTFQGTTEWMHGTFMQRLIDFVARAEMRLSRAHASNVVDGIPSTMWATDPVAAVTTVFTALDDQLLSSEDVQWWLGRMRGPGKPVNFVPVLDGNLKTWFKKDTLGYAEQLKAVPQCDVQRTFILHGPVAVKYANVVNEPVADILQHMHEELIELLRDPNDDSCAVLQPCELEDTSRETKEAGASWCERLAQSSPRAWQQQLLGARFIQASSGGLRRPNPLWQLLDNEQLTQAVLSEETIEFRSETEAVVVTLDGEMVSIVVDVGRHQLVLKLCYSPQLSWAPFQEAENLSLIHI